MYTYIGTLYPSAKDPADTVAAASHAGPGRLYFIIIIIHILLYECIVSALPPPANINYTHWPRRQLLFY